MCKTAALIFFNGISLLLLFCNNALCQPAGNLVLTTTKQDPTCGLYNGVITATASGGVKPYKFSFKGISTNTGYFPGYGPGVYAIGVTDASGVTETKEVTLTESIHPPTLSVANLTNPTGCSGMDGKVVLQATGGTPPYEYSLFYESNYQASNVFSNLAAGNYSFWVRDANGCIANVGRVQKLTRDCDMYVWSHFYSQLMFCGQQGEIWIKGVNGGTPPYKYSLDGINFSTNSRFTNLGQGIFNVHIKDAAGVTAVYAFQMFYSCGFDITYVSVDAACQGSDGSMAITAANGATPYMYTIDGINYQASNVFTGLTAGNYNITVKDQTGQTNSRMATVYDRCPVVKATTTAETCARNDGTITATATKGTAPYRYSLDGINFQVSNTFTGLIKGLFTVTLKDALNFTSTVKATINDGCLSITANVTDAACGNKNGKVEITAGSGTAPYQYSIDGTGFQAGNVFNGIGEGNYTITVKDAEGRTGTIPVIIKNIAGPQIATSVTPTSCSDNDGTVTIQGTGGTLPFQYSIGNGVFQNNNRFDKLKSGTYMLSVMDANGCIVTTSSIVMVNCPVVTAVVSNETCGAKNGRITTTATNGTGPYLYSIDGINFQTGTNFSALVAGTYTVTVKDALDVTNTTSVAISNICPEVSAVATNGLCGTANGSILATGSKGVTPYQYSIDGINFQAGNTFVNLVSATYTITVRDASGLKNTTNVVVDNFPGPEITVSNSPASCLNNDGKINITATGGTAPLQFSIGGNSFQSSSIFNNIDSGEYVVNAMDANGCFATGNTKLAVIDNLTLQTGDDLLICEGIGKILPASTNGTGFSWSPSASLNDNKLLNPIASPGVSTKYFINVSLGVCSKIDSITFLVTPAPKADAGKDSTICYGQSIQLNGSGGNIFEWSPVTNLDNSLNKSPIVSKPLNSVTYYLHVTDGNGCKSLQPSPVTVAVTPPAKVFAGNDTSIIMNQPFQLKALDINSSGFVQYEWSPSYGLSNNRSQNPVAILDKEIIYKVTASTQVGCEGSDEIKIKVYQGPEIYVPNAFTPNHDGRNDILKAIPVGIKVFKHFAIYNRWGHQVFFSTNPNNGWDGSFKNASQDTNAFIWMAEGIDKDGNIIKRKGTVTLIR